MRVGIDIHALGARQTGNETYLYNLIKAMLALKIEDVEWFLYRTRPHELPDWPVNNRRIRPHHPLLRIPVSFPIGLRRDRIEVAHFQYVIPPYCPCPVVVTIHDISYELFPGYFHPISRFRMRTLIPLAARQSRCVLTVSEFSKREIMRHYGLPESKVIAIHNGVAGHYRKVENTSWAREHIARLGLHRPFILGVGTLQPRKNLRRLIRVFSRMKENHLIEHDLILVGPSSYRAHQILAEVKKLGLEKAVKFTGYVSEEELVALYNEADLFVYPSVYEGFGLPPLEAMACGTPVVTSNRSSLPEVVGDAALLADPFEDDDLEDKILLLLKDGDLRTRLIRKGLTRAKLFTWRKAAEKTLAAYRLAAG